MRDKPLPDEEAPRKKENKKPNIFVRGLAFLVTLSLVLGAVALVVYRDRINLDAIRRYFSYRSLERGDSGQAESFSYGGAVGDSFAVVGGNLLVASQSSVQLYSGSGVLFVNRQAVLKKPVVTTAGSYALAYDAGGASLFLYKDKEEVFSLTLDGGRTLLSARVNSSGALAVTTQATGYKGSVTVYGADHNRMVQLNLSSSFIMDAAMTNDNKALAVVTVGQGGSGFESRLNLYLLENLKPGEEPVPDASCSLGNRVILDLDEDRAGIWLLGDTGLTLAHRDGSLAGSCDYGGRYLKEFSLGGDGFAAALLGKYRAGTLSDLVVADGTGAISATLPVSAQVLSLSAAGRYVAVLTADRLDIYTSDLEPYATLEGIQGARKVLMRSDGTAMLIANDTARLYIPG